MEGRTALSSEDLFDAVAGDHWWRVGKRRILATLMGASLKKLPPIRLLEAGCGDGFNIPMLRRFGEVDGLELEKPLQARAAAANPQSRIHNLAVGDQLDECFDAICIFDVLEHIRDEDEAVRWLYDHLRPGGRLFITVPAYRFLWTSHDEKWGHYRRYTRASLIKVLERFFVIRRTSYFNTFLFPAAIAAATLDRLRPLSSAGESQGGQGAINTLLTSIFGAERWLLRFLDFPFGVSLYAEGCRRPD